MMNENENLFAEALSACALGENPRENFNC